MGDRAALGYLVAGAALGLSSGLSPGPLLALVLAESLAGGWRQGAQVALAPLVTDSFMIALSLMALGHLPPAAFAFVEALGGLVLLLYGYGTIRAAWRVAAAARSPDHRRAPARRLSALWRGVSINALNPHAYLFWLTAGGPLVARAAQTGWQAAALFLTGFFGLLVGSKVALAVATGRGRTLLSGRAYRAVLTALGVVLGGLGLRAAVAGLAGFRT